MKHKLIAWIVCIALLIGLFGCSAVPEDHRSEPEHDAAISEPEPKEDEVTSPKEEPETEVTPEPETEQKPETVLGIDGLYVDQKNIIITSPNSIRRTSREAVDGDFKNSYTVDEPSRLLRPLGIGFPVLWSALMVLLTRRYNLIFSKVVARHSGF